jgi:SAM-dependent methyltransferase
MQGATPDSLLAFHDAGYREVAARLGSGIVVDIGCGNGALLAALSAAGLRHLHGVDPAPNAQATARTAFGLTGVRRGTMADCEQVVPLRDAQVVLIMAVLEHLWNPRRDLARLLAQLQPGCKVIIEVPALETFDGSRGEPFGELSLEHIQFFSLRSLDSFMRTLGAQPAGHRLVDLPSIEAKALLGMYEITSSQSPPVHAGTDGDAMRSYLRLCASRWDAALACVPTGELAIYGAGSHTARLLPALARRGDAALECLVDTNPNLQGRRMGGHVIASPAELARHPTVPVLVSSYRYQSEIRTRLESRHSNPVVTLYGARHAPSR